MAVGSSRVRSSKPRTSLFLLPPEEKVKGRRLRRIEAVPADRTVGQHGRFTESLNR
jgi:hypothetical protein